MLIGAVFLCLGSGCGDDETRPGPGDTIPPAAVADLAISSIDSSVVTLRWTATGDDSMGGNAASYDIRYDNDPIGEAEWDSASILAGEPAPGSPGAVESFSIEGLYQELTYYFAMKVADEVPNWSGLSNVASNASGPAPVLSLSPDSLGFGRYDRWQPLEIRNRGDGTMSWSATADRDWLVVAPAAGSTGTERDTVEVWVARADLPLGGYSGTVTVGTDGGSTLSVTVEITVSDMEERAWHVRPDGRGDAPTIRAALDSASAGDTILVGCGIHHEYRLPMKSGVLLRGESGHPDCATIDAGGRGTIIVCDEVDSTAAIAGLTLTGGVAEGAFPENSGGAIHCWESSPAISDCIIVQNGTGLSGQGGGIFCGLRSSPKLDRVDFLSNSADHNGGAVGCWENSHPLLTACTFVGNRAGNNGGGVTCMEGSVAIVTGCDFTNNVAIDGSGGALAADYPGAEIRSCTFSRNRGRGGGACYFPGAFSGSIEDCIFRENSTYRYAGGAVSIGRHNGWGGPGAVFVRCSFQSNTALESNGNGGALSIGTNCALDECTFTGNAAGQNGGVVDMAGYPPTGITPHLAIHAGVFSENSAGGDGGCFHVGYGSIDLDQCEFTGNLAGGEGGVARIEDSGITVDSSSFSNCAAPEGGVFSGLRSTFTVYASTFSGNDGSGSLLLAARGRLTIDRSIVAFAAGGDPVIGDRTQLAVTCSDFFGNEGGDWVGSLVGLDTLGGNFAADPLFCDVEAGDFRLSSASPCLGANQPDSSGCGTIGAFAEGCSR